MSSIRTALEPAIRPYDIGRSMRCFDSCQLTMILWQSTKANVQVVDRLFGKQASKGPHVVQLRMYAHAMRPRANAAYRDDHEKRDAWVSYFYAWFSLVCPISIGMVLRAAEAPLLWSKCTIYMAFHLVEISFSFPLELSFFLVSSCLKKWREQPLWCILVADTMNLNHFLPTIPFLS